MSSLALTAIALLLGGAVAVALRSRRRSAAGANEIASRTPAIRRIAFASAGLALAAVALAGADPHRGVDGLSACFLLLTAAVWPSAIYVARQCDQHRPALLYSLLLLLEGTFIGLFSAEDPLLFCSFLGSSSFLTFLLIAGWGGPNAAAAARKFLYFRLVGGFLVLIGVLGLLIAADRMSESAARSAMQKKHSLESLARDIPKMAADEVGANEYWDHARRWILTVLVLGFAIETPLVPFHTWFAGSVAEGPLCVGIALVGTGLHASAYAWGRFVAPLCGDLGHGAWILVLLATLGALHESFVALAHSDPRRTVAWSSLSQAALSIGAICTLSTDGLVGGLLVALAGGTAFALLLFAVGVVEDGQAAGETLSVGGLGRVAPQTATILLVAVLSLAGIPGLGGFTALYATVAAIFETSWWTAFAALAAGLIVAWSLFGLLERLSFGQRRLGWRLAEPPFLDPTEPGRQKVSGDLAWVEFVCLAPLLIAVFFLGLRPQTVIDWLNRSLHVPFSP